MTAPAGLPRSRKLCTLPGLLAAALLSVIAAIPFLPALRSDAPGFALEVRMASSASGLVKIYYDIGRGYNEADSAAQALVPGDAAHTYRLPLRAGDYRSLRVDPIDGPGTVRFDGPLRVLSEQGLPLRTIALNAIQPLQQVALAHPEPGRLEVRATGPANDPQLVVAFAPPFRLTATWGGKLRGLGFRAGGVFAGLALLLLSLDRSERARAALQEILRLGQVHPARAVALVAAVAVVASAYPVVFLGKSFVSPNFGTGLLYETYPTLPGGPTVEATPNGSDVGPAAWQNVPYSFIQHRALAQGELPLWNRYTLTGTPLLAQGQSMFGDPLHFLVLLGGGAAWAWDLKYLGAKWLFAAGLGLSVLALGRAARMRDAGPLPSAEPPRSALRPPSASPLPSTGTSSAAGTPRSVEAVPLTGPRPLGGVGENGPYLLAAFLVALAAPFIGFFVYRVNHPAIFSLGYAPWVLYAWIRLAPAHGRRELAWACSALLLANFALLNSGTVKEACVLILVLNFTGASYLLASAGPWRARRGRLALAGWTGAVLLLITAPVWSTFLQTLPQAFTASMSAAADQIQPSLLLAAFDELFFRPLSRDELVFNPALNFLFLLGLLYFVATLRVHGSNRPVMALAGCALIFMAFAFGVVPRGWIVQLPFLAHVGHIDNTFLCGLMIVWPLLAAVGFATAATRLGTPAGRGDLAMAAVALLAVVGAWIGFHQASHRAVYGPGSVVSVMPSGQVIPIRPFIWGSLAALLAASATLAFVARHALQRRALGPAGALLAAMCVGVLLWRQGLHATSIGTPTYVLQPPPRADFQAPSSAIGFVQAGQSVAPTRLFGLDGNLTAGWNAVYGLEAIYGPDALQNRWVRQLIDAGPLTWSSTWRVSLVSRDAAKSRPFLDAFNVRYYLDRPANPPLQDESLTLSHTSDLNVYESATPWPRAFFTDRLDVYGEPAELVSKIQGANGRPFAAVQRGDAEAEGAGRNLPRDLATRTATAATDYRLTANTTAFTVRATGPGAVVLIEAFWPGDFRAEVNGRKARVLRLNHAFKGVIVDAAGEYRITFRYVPKNFPRNLALSALGLALLAGSLGLAFRSTPARHA